MGICIFPLKGIIDDIIKMAVKTAEAESKKQRKHEKVISQLYKVNTRIYLQY
jgi:hypothetical protein